MLTDLIENRINLKHNEFFCVIIGSNPSKGARSPKLWNKVFNKEKMKIKMYPLDVKIENLNKVLNILQNNRYFLGGSIAVPYKQKVFKFLKNNIDTETKKIGTVNCLYRKKFNKNLFGTNTDGLGFMTTLKNNYRNLRNKKILVIGFGGTAKAVLAHLSNKNNKLLKLTIISRKKLNNKVIKKFNSNWIGFSKIKNSIYDYDVIINATSIGFDNQKNLSPIPQSLFKNLKSNVFIYDIIYNPKLTLLLKICKANKISSINGKSMNLEQAVIAFKKVLPKIKIDKIRKIMSSVR